MKKSLIGLGVIAAMAVGGAANAGTFGSFTIAGGAWDGSNSGTFDGSLLAGNGASVGLNLGALTGSGLQSLTAGTAATVRDALGLSAPADNGTLVYFGLSHNGKGYFGVMFLGNGNNFELTMNNATPPGIGVYREFGSSTLETLGVNYKFEAKGFGNTLLAGSANLWLFTQMPDLSTLGGGSASDGNLTVRYMSYTGGVWTTAASGTGLPNSLLNTATFVVPVPAPALLAGLGLAGALALRRRMK